MKKLIFLLLTFSLSACVTAPPEPGLFNDPKAAEKAKHCQKLQEEIDSLNGKPIQRGTAMENYAIDCLNDN